MITLGCVGDVFPGPNQRGPLLPKLGECGIRRSEPDFSVDFLGLWPLAPKAPLLRLCSSGLYYEDTKHQGLPCPDGRGTDVTTVPFHL